MGEIGINTTWPAKSGRIFRIYMNLSILAWRFGTVRDQVAELLYSWDHFSMSFVWCRFDRFWRLPCFNCFLHVPTIGKMCGRSSQNYETMERTQKTSNGKNTKNIKNPKSRKIESKKDSAGFIQQTPLLKVIIQSVTFQLFVFSGRGQVEGSMESKEIYQGNFAL